MKLPTSFLLSSALLAPSVLLAACGDQGDPSSAGDGDGGESGGGKEGETEAGDWDEDGDPKDREITLSFRAQVGDEQFACGATYTDQGSTRIAVTPQDFRLYVSEIVFITESGAEAPMKLEDRPPFQAPEVALLDFEDGSAGCRNGNAALNTEITGTVATDEVLVSVVFSAAVPKSLNHRDPAELPDPLQAGGMTWGWLFGYKFIVAELAAIATPLEGDEAGAGVFHLGSTGCDNTPAEGGAGGIGPDLVAPPTIECDHQNRPRIRLNGFSPDDVIVADIGAMMSGADLSINSSCHSGGPACGGYFDSVGLDFATGEPDDDQSAFRVEPR